MSRQGVAKLNGTRSHVLLVGALIAMFGLGFVLILITGVDGGPVYSSRYVYDATYDGGLVFRGVAGEDGSLEFSSVDVAGNTYLSSLSVGCPLVLLVNKERHRVSDLTVVMLKAMAAPDDKITETVDSNGVQWVSIESSAAMVEQSYRLQGQFIQGAPIAFGAYVYGDLPDVVPFSLGLVDGAVFRLPVSKREIDQYLDEPRRMERRRKH